MPKAAVPAGEKPKGRMGGWRAALFGAAGLAAAGAASPENAQAAQGQASLEQPTYVEMQPLAPAPELRTPSGQKVELRPLEQVVPREVAPAPQLRKLEPAPELRPLAPAPEIRSVEIDPVTPAKLDPGPGIKY
ncbi:MAG: hypothetical protein KGI03_03920 [Patescibacteria group bacterium]|nr:hypothetical protein [Patescibacteria group bacterium]